MATAPQKNKTSPLKTDYIIGIVIVAVSCTALCILAVYLLYQRKKASPGRKRKKTTHALVPWLSSSSPVYISRPMPTQSEESLCRSVSDYKGYEYPALHSYQGPTNTMQEYSNGTDTHIEQERLSLPGAARASENRFPRDTLGASVQIPATPLAMLERPRPALRQQSPRPRMIPISTAHKQTRPDKRNTTRRSEFRPTTEALSSKSSISGKTIVIHNDTRTRPPSAFSDEHRISMFPSTPSDPGHTTFSRYMTPATSRHTSFIKPGWQNEEMPERPEGY